ncbi:MAG TPA: DMT family transporter [Actinophytocola sp.]|jgi:drug/metabolite transporter (DMT)-like permease|uniref:DMT family transporter n=1 Tax=Actinophytocola sp. TaxID=1872138 RepID=UPI002F93C468
MSSLRGPLLIAGLALAWGSNFLWIKVALEAFGPMQLTVARIVLGALFLLVVIAVRRERLPRDLATWRHLFVAALVGNTAPYTLYALGEIRVDSGIAGSLNATTPLWTLALGLAARQISRLTVPQFGGLLLGFGGCLLVFTPWDAGAVDPLGALCCLCAGLSYGISYLYMSRFLTPRQLSPTVLSAGQLLAACVLSAATLPLDPAGTPEWSTGPWLAMIVLGVVGSGFAYVLNYALIRTEGAVGASVVTYLIPIASLGLGFLVLGESVPLLAIAGVAAILVGVAASRRSAPIS